MTSVPFREVNLEQAIKIADELTDKKTHEGRASTVYWGNHPEYGPVHVVIPPMGASLLLPAATPIVVQSEAL